MPDFSLFGHLKCASWQHCCVISYILHCSRAAGFRKTHPVDSINLVEDMCDPAVECDDMDDMARFYCSSPPLTFPHFY